MDNLNRNIDSQDKSNPNRCLAEMSYPIFTKILGKKSENVSFKKDSIGDVVIIEEKILADSDLILELLLNQKNFSSRIFEILIKQCKTHKIYITSLCIEKIFFYLGSNDFQVAENAIIWLENTLNIGTLEIDLSCFSKLSTIKDINFDCLLEETTALKRKISSVITLYPEQYSNNFRVITINLKPLQKEEICRYKNLVNSYTLRSFSGFSSSLIVHNKKLERVLIDTNLVLNILFGSSQMSSRVINIARTLKDKNIDLYITNFCIKKIKFYLNEIDPSLSEKSILFLENRFSIINEILFNINELSTYSLKYIDVNTEMLIAKKASIDSIFTTNPALYSGSVLSDIPIISLSKSSIHNHKIDEIHIFDKETDDLQDYYFNDQGFLVEQYAPKSVNMTDRKLGEKSDLSVTDLPALSITTLNEKFLSHNNKTISELKHPEIGQTQTCIEIKTCVSTPLPHVNIIGCPITALPLNELNKLIINWAKSFESRSVCLANVHTVMEANSNKGFAYVLHNADIVTPEEMHLVWMMNLLGKKNQNLVSGMELFLNLCKQASHEKVKVYFLGSQQATLDRMRTRLDLEYPNLEIAAMTPLPFRPLTSKEDAAVIKDIHESAAGIIFLSLGCPKQEAWISEHQGQVKAVMVGLGGVFPVYAGFQKLAPRWVKQSGFEWLYRLKQEPRRLFGRYYKTIPPFMYFAFVQLFTHFLSKHKLKLKYFSHESN